MVFSSEGREEIQEIKGKFSFSDKGLMHSVMASDEKRKDAKLTKESINQGMGAFVPDDIYENLVNNFSNAERLYGRTFLNLVSGYSFTYLERNVKIPEFQRELKKKIENMIESLEEEGLIDEEGRITEKAEEVASLILYVEELENIVPKGILGEKLSKRAAHYGEKGDVKSFRKGDRYKNLAIRKINLK